MAPKVLRWILFMLRASRNAPVTKLQFVLHRGKLCGGVLSLHHIYKGKDTATLRYERTERTVLPFHLVIGLTPLHFETLRGCSNGIGCNTCFWPHTFLVETAAFLRSKERKPEKKTVLRGNKLTSKRAHPLSCRNEVNRSVSRPDGREAESSWLNLSWHYHSTDAPDLQWFNWQCVLFHFFF